MKFFVTTLILLFCCFFSSAQNKTIDSLAKELVKEKTDTGKADILVILSYYYKNYRPDSALILAQTSYSLSKKHNYLGGESFALGGMADAFALLDNYSKAIEYYIEQLKIEEKRNSPRTIANIYLSMALVYNSDHDVAKALSYAYTADSIIKQHNLSELALYSNLDIGDIYEKANMLDSAMLYTQRCHQLAFQQNNSLIIGTAFNNLGNIYLKQKKVDSAFANYTASIPYLTANEDYNMLSECKLGLAKIYQEKGQIDSARLFAKQVFKIALQTQFLNKALDASTFLVNSYKNEKKIDSAFAYQQIMVSLKESIDNKERIKKFQNITIAEQLRQREIVEARQLEAEDRKQKLQLLSIGIMIPVLFFVSVYLSRKKVHKRLIQFCGVLSLLMLFEYITLLLHPWVAEKTHHSPFIEIIVFVAIASLLTPAHHKIQEWLIERLSKMHEHHLQNRLKALQKITPEEDASVD